MLCINHTPWYTVAPVPRGAPCKAASCKAFLTDDGHSVKLSRRQQCWQRLGRDVLYKQVCEASAPRKRSISLHSGRNFNSSCITISSPRLCGQAFNSVCQESTPIDESPDCNEDLEYGDDEGDAWLVDESTTPFNQISVIELDEGADHDFAGAYVLKLDTANLIHSVFLNDGRVWTGSYFDVFASLPPVLPEGPIGILGLGAGTMARLLLHVYPSLNLEGWELDPEVVRLAREYFGLLELESSPEMPSRNQVHKSRSTPLSDTLDQTPSRDFQKADAHASSEQRRRFTKKSRSRTGRLVVHVGDSLGPDAVTEGGFAGIMIDLFRNGTVCKELGEVGTWRWIKERLRPSGRVMVNCVPNCSALGVDEDADMLKDWDQTMQAIVRSMAATFPGEVSVRVLTEEGSNVMLMSGKPPDIASWSSKVPDCLVQGVQEWKLWDENTPLARNAVMNRSPQL